MKKFLTILGFLIIGVYSYAQDSGKWYDRLNINADIETSHVWKGIIGSDVPSLNGELNYTFDKKGYLKLGIWGGMGLTDDNNVHYHEVDYYLNYDTGKFAIGVWDVFSGEKAFKYKRKTTGHRLDLRGYYVISDHFPLKIDGVFSFYGDDRKIDKDVEQRYSTYVGLTYPLVRNQIVNLDVFCGGAFAINGGQSHFYGDGKHDFDIVNVGGTLFKDIPVLGYKLPVQMTIMWNPSTNNAKVHLLAHLF